MKKLTAIFLAAVLGLYPLYVGSGGYRSIEQDKYIIFLLLCGSMTLLLLCCMFRNLFSKKCDIRHLRQLPHFVYFAITLLLFVAISAVISPYRDRVWLGGARKDGFLTWVLYIGSFLAVAKWGSLHRLHEMMLTVCLLVSAVLAILQKSGLNPLGLYPEGTDWANGGRGFLATIGNVDFLSAFASLAMLLLFGRYVIKTQTHRWIPLLGASLGMAVLCLADAQAGRLGAAAAVFFGLWFAMQKRLFLRRYLLGLAVLTAVSALFSCLHFRQLSGETVFLFGTTAKTVRRLMQTALLAGGGIVVQCLPVPEKMRAHKKVFIVLLMSALLIGTVLLLYFFGEKLGGAVRPIYKILHGTASAQTGNGRIEIWRQARILIAERPLFGGGPDTMGLRNDMGLADHAHSIFLNLWVNSGIFSTVFYCLLLGSLLLRGFRSKKAEVFALVLPVLAYAVQAAVSVDEFIVAPLFWSVLGLLAGELKAEGFKHRPPNTEGVQAVRI